MNYFIFVIWHMELLRELILAKNEYCDLCNPPQTHTMCKYPPGPNAACKNYETRTISVKDKTGILADMNKIRNDVAMGMMENRFGSHPPAANMRQLEWDNELQEIAQRWADQCIRFVEINQRDYCRDTRRFSVGQNIATTSSSQRSDINFTVGIDMFFRDRRDFDPQWVEKYEDVPIRRSTKHYTQLVWAETKYVGCGYSSFQDKIGEKLRWIIRIVCNFGPSGNIEGQKVYEVGLPCSSCPNGTRCSRDVRGLCTDKTGYETDDEEGEDSADPDLPSVNITANMQSSESETDDQTISLTEAKLTESINQKSPERTSTLTKQISAPTKITSASTKITSAPTKVTFAPTKITSTPTKITSTPTKITSAPTKITSAPTKITSAPTKITSAPTKITSAPTKITSAPTKITSASPEQTSVSTEQTSTLSEPTFTSAEKTSSSTEQTSDLTEETSNSTEETSDSTEETSDSSEETSTLSEETSGSTEISEAEESETTPIPTTVDSDYEIDDIDTVNINFLNRQDTPSTQELETTSSTSTETESSTETSDETSSTQELTSEQTESSVDGSLMTTDCSPHCPNSSPIGYVTPPSHKNDSRYREDGKTRHRTRTKTGSKSGSKSGSKTGSRSGSRSELRTGKKGRKKSDKRRKSTTNSPPFDETPEESKMETTIEVGDEGEDDDNTTTTAPYIIITQPLYQRYTGPREGPYQSKSEPVCLCPIPDEDRGLSVAQKLHVSMIQLFLLLAMLFL